MRAATRAEIRAHLGHDKGNRKVKIGRDGRVTYYGSTTDTDRAHDYWHEGRFVEEYGVDDTGAVVTGRSAGRPLKGDQRRLRYNVMLEPRLKDRAEQIGKGNISAGIALALEKFELETIG